MRRSQSKVQLVEDPLGVEVASPLELASSTCQWNAAAGEVVAANETFVLDAVGTTPIGVAGQVVLRVAGSPVTQNVFTLGPRLPLGLMISVVCRIDDLSAPTDHSILTSMRRMSSGLPSVVPSCSSWRRSSPPAWSPKPSLGRRPCRRAPR